VVSQLNGDSSGNVIPLITGGKGTGLNYDTPVPVVINVTGGFINASTFTITTDPTPISGTSGTAGVFNVSGTVGPLNATNIGIRSNSWTLTTAGSTLPAGVSISPADGTITIGTIAPDFTGNFVVGVTVVNGKKVGSNDPEDVNLSATAVTITWEP